MDQSHSTAARQTARAASAFEQRPLTPSPQALPAADPAGCSPSHEVHTWLEGRIAQLQRKGTTRWQRLVSFLLGGPSGKDRQ